MEQRNSASQNNGPSTMAVATLVLAILGIFTSGAAAIAALVFGYWEMARIRSGRSPVAGQRMTRAGIIVAWITLAVIVITAAVMILVFHPMIKQIQDLSGGGQS